MNEYRCTRALPYADFNFEDKTNSAFRQGYYIAAVNAITALNRMRAEFPNDEAECKRRGIKAFTVKFHRKLPLKCILA